MAPQPLFNRCLIATSEISRAAGNVRLFDIIHVSSSKAISHISYKEFFNLLGLACADIVEQHYDRQVVEQ